MKLTAVWEQGVWLENSRDAEVAMACDSALAFARKCRSSIGLDFGRGDEATRTCALNLIHLARPAR